MHSLFGLLICQDLNRTEALSGTLADRGIVLEYVPSVTAAMDLIMRRMVRRLRPHDLIVFALPDVRQVEPDPDLHPADRVYSQSVRLIRFLHCSGVEHLLIEHKPQPDVPDYFVIWTPDEHRLWFKDPFATAYTVREGELDLLDQALAKLCEAQEVGS